MQVFFAVSAASLFLVAQTATIDQSDVTFCLFTAPNKNCVPIDYRNGSKYVDKDAEVIILIHGWNTNATTQWYKNVTDAFFTRRDKKYNIIQVDYTKVSTENYFSAVSDVREVADLIGAFVVNLTKDGVSLKDVRLVGHSLGGQIAGYVGQYVKKKLSKKLPEICGLDPAGPLFNLRPASKKLSKSDAKVVYCIHTDAGIFGYARPCGGVDVYPNGGDPPQAGCPNVPFDASCSHGKAHQYYASAVAHRNSLLATRCDNYSDFKAGKCDGNKKIDLGQHLTPEDNGSYYLTTTDAPPFRRNP